MSALVFLQAIERDLALMKRKPQEYSVLSLANRCRCALGVHRAAAGNISASSDATGHAAPKATCWEA